MQRPLHQGSAFRNKLPKEPKTKDIEAAVVNSGLLGKKPSQYKIKYSKPSLADQKPPAPEIFVPPVSARAGNNIKTPSRPQTATSRAKTPVSARRRDLSRPQTPSSMMTNTPDLTPRNLKETKNVNVPNIFYAKILSSNDPPSVVNFLQLSEVLDRLLKQQQIYEEKYEKQKQIQKVETPIDQLEIENEDSNIPKADIENSLEKENDNETGKDVENEVEYEIDEEKLKEYKKKREKEKNELTKIYHSIFGEVIRQYFVECTAQGDVLSICRDFFAGAYDHIPNIRKHYDDIIEEIIKQTKNHRGEIMKLGPEIEKNLHHSERLKGLIEEFRKDLKVLVDHHDVLMNNISTAFKELMEMKANINQMNSRLESKNKKLMELIEELRSLDSISASYTSDTIRFAENLRSIRIQQENGRKQITICQNEVDRLKDTISRVDKEITTFTEDIERSRIKPETANFAAQVDLVSRRLFKESKPIEILMRPNVYTEEFTGNLYQRIRQEYQHLVGAGPQSTGEYIVIDSYDDFAKFKKVLLKNEEKLHMSNEVIEAASNGNFSLLNLQNNDFVRIFASNLSRNIVADAIIKPPIHQVSTQVLAQQQEFEPEETGGDRLKAHSRFLGMIESDYSQRAPQSFEWLCNTIHDIYNAKAIDDDKVLNESYATDLINFPEYIYHYAHNKFQIKFLADQFCWDVYITSHEHKGRTQEIDIFVGFLDEVFNAEQLAFFLIGRSDCLKVGSSVTIFTRDQIEKCSELFLSNDQIETYMRIWWLGRYRKSFYNSVLELSQMRPSIHLEATKRYCAMHDILLKNIIFYAEDAVDRLHDLLLQHRITPRLTLPQFNKLMKLMIPSLTQQQLADFYRATVTKAKQRTNISLDDFVNEFNATSILINRYEKVIEEGNNEEMLRTVEQLWNQKRVELLQVYEFFASQSSLQPDNLTLKTYFDDSTKFLSNLNHSIAIGDGNLATIHFYQFMFSLDILFSTIHEYDLPPDSLVSLECAVRENWLEKVFF
ncbi:hypothetical protein TRFO_40597 [Tritrichomonas foetus]|uniref:Uncharacterized protein n=1 Tax=Tritrichomonas foetus TaxID=1144522 RepID=A0A1J4J0J4_9EUKA|nr:hypothetical protein TRFO_40597 [Tritrichomonas foetus]|eukprot:OHS93096.1 hypothetical protein TRFO_40597 [Tritrichomonas foetus]